MFIRIFTVVVAILCLITFSVNLVHADPNEADPATFQIVEKMLHEDYAKKTHVVRTGRLIQTQPKIIQRIKKMVIQTKSELVLTSFFCDPEAPLTLAIIEGIRELQATIQDEQKHQLDADHHLPIKLRFLTDRDVGLASWFFGGIASKDALVCFADLTKDLDPNIIQMDYSAWEHSSVGASHGKYVIRDGHEILLPSMNLAQRTFFETAFTLDSASLAEDLYANFSYLRRQAHTLFTNFAAPEDGKNPTFPKVEIQKLNDKEFKKIESEAIVSNRNESGNILLWSHSNSQDQAFLLLFKSAQHSIKIITPNLNFKNYVQVFSDALRRGVDVEIVLSHGLADEFEGTSHLQGGSNTEVKEKLEAEYAKLQEAITENDPALGQLTIRWFTLEDGSEPFGPDKNAHAKFMSIDHSISVFGSANMDTQSWYHSSELNVILHDPKRTQHWEKTFFNPMIYR